MAEEDQTEKPQFNYFRMKKAYYELGIHQELGLVSHSLFLALLHKANNLHFPRFFRISGRELADLAVLSDRSVRLARANLIKFSINNLPLVLYWRGNRGKAPTFAIIYELLDLEANHDEVERKITELRLIMVEMKKWESPAKKDGSQDDLAAPHAAKSEKAASHAAKDSGTTCRYPPLSGIVSGTTCRDPNKLLGSINTPLPINDISMGENENENVGEEGEEILSKRNKTEKEIQDIILQLAQHSVKSERVATQLAKKYTTSFIYRHIMQVKHDHRKGQHWKDPGGILVARIRKGDPTPDFPPEEYPESVYVQKFATDDGIPRASEP